VCEVQTGNVEMKARVIRVESFRPEKGSPCLLVAPLLELNVSQVHETFREVRLNRQRPAQGCLSAIENSGLVDPGDELRAAPNGGLVAIMQPAKTQFPARQ